MVIEVARAKVDGHLTCWTAQFKFKRPSSFVHVHPRFMGQFHRPLSPHILITKRQTLSRWSSVTSIRSLDSILSFNPDNFGADKTMTNEKEPDKYEGLTGRGYERLLPPDGVKVDDRKYQTMQKQIQESKIISDTVLLAAKGRFNSSHWSILLTSRKWAFDKPNKELERATDQSGWCWFCWFIDWKCKNSKNHFE